MALLNELGKRLKTIRIYSGIKQKELADKLKISPSLLSLYEQGSREPSITFLDSFCNYYDITLSHLFSFESNRERFDLNIPAKELISDLQLLLGKLEKEKFSNIDA